VDFSLYLKSLNQLYRPTVDCKSKFKYALDACFLDHTNTGSSGYHHNKFIVWVSSIRFSLRGGFKLFTTVNTYKILLSTINIDNRTMTLILFHNLYCVINATITALKGLHFCHGNVKYHFFVEFSFTNTMLF
jgi:hypothetical protein